MDSGALQRHDMRLAAQEFAPSVFITYQPRHDLQASQDMLSG
jgi:hypothetical protein